eukprot:2495894-Pyramimonas_sp.AAC.1
MRSLVRSVHRQRNVDGGGDTRTRIPSSRQTYSYSLLSSARLLFIVNVTRAPAAQVRGHTYVPAPPAASAGARWGGRAGSARC